MNLGKKGIGAGQVFVFVIAAITFSLIMIFGYKAITGFLQSGESVEFAQFKNDLESSVQRIYTEFGSVRIETYRLPDRYQQVCFVNLDYQENGRYSFQEELCSQDQIACTAWEDAVNDAAANSQTPYESTDQNVFLTPPATVPLKIFHFSISDPDNPNLQFFCRPVRDGKFSVVLEGGGDRTIISPSDNG